MKKIQKKIINPKGASCVIKGTAKSGYILEVYNAEDNFRFDVALTSEELKAIHTMLSKYYATRK